MYQTPEQKEDARNNVIMWLMNYAMDHQKGITFIYTVDKEETSESFPEFSTAVINANYKNIDEIPFIVGHEIGHLMLGHTKEKFYASPANKIRMERDANKYSIGLLDRYCELNNIYFENRLNFARSFGVPSACYHLL